MRRSVVVLLLLAGSLVVSRLVFALLDDPEGPNPVVVGALGLGIFAASSLVLLVASTVCRSTGRGRRRFPR